MKDFLVEWRWRSTEDYTQIFSAYNIQDALNQAIRLAKKLGEDKFPDFYPSSIEEV